MMIYKRTVVRSKFMSVVMRNVVLGNISCDPNSKTLLHIATVQFGIVMYCTERIKFLARDGMSRILSRITPMAHANRVTKEYRQT